MVGLELGIVLAAALATRGHSAVLFFFGLVFWPIAMAVVLLVEDQRHRCPHCRRDPAAPGLSATA
jgi:hypothetical protein